MISRILCIIGVVIAVSLFLSHKNSYEETMVLMFSLYLYYTFGKTDEDKKS